MVNEYYNTSIVDCLEAKDEIFKISKKTMSEKEFIALFSDTGLFSKIRNLEISKSNLNLEMVAYLLETLKYLNLNSVKNLNKTLFGDAGAQAIAHSENMKNLPQLQL